MYDSLIFRETTTGNNLININSDAGSSIGITNCTFIDKNSGNIGFITKPNETTFAIFNSVFYGNSLLCNNSKFFNTGASAGVISTINACTHQYTYQIDDTDFTNFSSNNFIPASTSTNLVNKGDDNCAGSFDLTGKPRKVGTVDIGCYERQ